MKTVRTIVLKKNTFIYARILIFVVNIPNEHFVVNMRKSGIIIVNLAKSEIWGDCLMFIFLGNCLSLPKLYTVLTVIRAPP